MLHTNSLKCKNWSNKTSDLIRFKIHPLDVISSRFVKINTFFKSKFFWINPTNQNRVDFFFMDFKNKVKINKHAPTQTETIDFHGAIDGFDNSFDLVSFAKNLKIKILSLDKEHMVFDMSGVDAAIANAFRRIMISEVPTMAIEQLVIVNNTSIIQDEVLAHRVGLIPIKVDARHFNYKSNNVNLS
jgi:hypothetical protein